MEIIYTKNTFKPMALIFSASWSEATLLGAHTNTCETYISCLKFKTLTGNCKQAITNQNHPKCMPFYLPWPCFAKWYTIAANVTIFPILGGPWIKLTGFCKTLLTTLTCTWTKDKLQFTTVKIFTPYQWCSFAVSCIDLHVLYNGPILGYSH